MSRVLIFMLALMPLALPLAGQAPKERLQEEFLARLSLAWKRAERPARRGLLRELTAGVAGKRFGRNPAERAALGTWLRERLRASPQDPELNLFLAAAMWGGECRELSVIGHAGARESSTGYLSRHRSWSLQAGLYDRLAGALGLELLQTWSRGFEGRRMTAADQGIAMALVDVFRPRETHGRDAREWSQLGSLREQATHALAIMHRFAKGNLHLESPKVARGPVGKDGGQSWSFAPSKRVQRSFFASVATTKGELSLRLPSHEKTGPARSTPGGGGESAFLAGLLPPGKGAVTIEASRALHADEELRVLIFPSRPWSRGDICAQTAARRRGARRGGGELRSERTTSPLLPQKARLRSLFGSPCPELLQVETDELLLKEVFLDQAFRWRGGAIPANVSLFLEHASVDDEPDIWEVSLNGGPPLRFIAQACPRPARMRLPPGLLKASGNVIRLRRVSGGAILIDGVGLAP
jgi:hypothetical protein